MELLVKDLINQLKLVDKFNWVAIWNNQLARMTNAEEYAIQNPSAYVELETLEFGQLLREYQGVDITVRLHIIGEELNALDDTIDNFYSIFGLRDAVVRQFSLYNAEQGGFMVKTNEYQSYDHDNLYHYVIEYIFHYIDDSAVQPKIIKNPPTDLDINVVIDN